MNTKYYVRGKRINLDDWDINGKKLNHKVVFDDIDEHDEENVEYITDRHGRILGIGVEYEQ